MQFFIKRKKINNFLFVLTITIVFPFLIFIKEPGYHPWSVSETIINIFLLLFFIMSIYVNKNIFKIPITYKLFTILYVLIQVLLLFGSTSYTSALNSIILHDKYILLSVAIFYFIGQQNEDILIKYLLLVAVLSVYIGIYKLSKDFYILQSLYQNVGGFLRKASIFPNPNMFGMYLFVCIFFTIYIIDKVDIRYKFLIILLIFLPMIMSIILTFSRRSWGLFILGLIVFLIVKKGSKYVYLLALFILFVIIFYSIDYTSVIKRFMLIFNNNYQSNYLRIKTLDEVLKIFSNNFFIFLGGNGVGLYGPTTDITSWKQIDSYYAQLILEFGFIGLLFYLLIFFSVVYYGLRTLKYLNRMNLAIEYNKILLYLICYIGLYLSGIVGSTPITFPLNMLQWVLAGLIIKNYIIHKQIYYTRIKNAKI